MNRSLKIRGIVLRRKPWGEKDLLVELLSEDAHLNSLILKGAAKEGSRRKALVDGLNFVEAEVYQSKDRFYVQSIECLDAYLDLKENLNHVLLAQEFLESVRSRLHGNLVNQNLFQMVQEALEALRKDYLNPIFPHWIKIHMAQHFGYLPNFKECGSCHKSLDEDLSFWDERNLFLSCTLCKRDQFSLKVEKKYRNAIHFFKERSLEDCPSLNLKESEALVLDQILEPLLSSSQP